MTQKILKLCELVLTILALLSTAYADDITVTVNVTQIPIYPIFKSLVGLGMGISFFFLVTRFFFDIDLLKTKNPLVSLVLSMIGIAVILIIFISLWGML
jgi:hypothetical protein